MIVVIKEIIAETEFGNNVEIRIYYDEETLEIVQIQPDGVHDGMIWEQDWYSFIDLDYDEKVEFIKESLESIYSSNDADFKLDEEALQKILLRDKRFYIDFGSYDDTQNYDWAEIREMMTGEPVESFVSIEPVSYTHLTLPTKRIV